MKKLSLKKLKLGADDMLQRNQLKSVLGGYGLGENAWEECWSGDGSGNAEMHCICHFSPDIDYGRIPCIECMELCSYQG
ncbi:hypothetical protein Q4Q35_06990 [Flavivirga aquimarina]|uniref:Natural product n=1 Tax=Flavivirga aquimarina TaxID=2027862 RepID=A0ABT8W911_9FLAO|nr:hypothetical protein [Flavivirga aquimarina]MDO5969547.1 hypothetical protein [Flavivirga aquimarina]